MSGIHAAKDKQEDVVTLITIQNLLISCLRVTNHKYMAVLAQIELQLYKKTFRGQRENIHQVCAVSAISIFLVVLWASKRFHPLSSVGCPGYIWGFVKRQLLHFSWRWLYSHRASAKQLKPKLELSLKSITAWVSFVVSLALSWYSICVYVNLVLILLNVYGWPCTTMLQSPTLQTLPPKPLQMAIRIRWQMIQTRNMPW